MVLDLVFVFMIVVIMYDGIFKNMYDEKIRDMFMDICINILKGNWEKVDDILM